ncbi:MAG: hypothetical protein B6D55_05920 [Candidatus Omnitrophica bacterium 4484_70.2]|nr:MAG: hypothetical protein B6D55_05920 [Candidatus Omnitrophica bacterium 4484_70.2]
MTKELSTDLGNIRIHKDVVRDISYEAIKEVPQVLRVHYSLIDKILKLFKPTRIVPIKVNIDTQQSKIEVSVPVVIKYGMNISKVASEIQEKIALRLQEHIDSFYFQVNVDVRGIEGG